MAIDGLNRLARVLQRPEDPRPLPIAPWIEPTFEAWLRSQPPERPVYAFVNFLDLHEKFLSDAELIPNLWRWTGLARLPQNTRLWLQGKWVPTSEELLLLRRLYEALFSTLSARVDSLIEILRRAGRWDNTLLVVTSDHGQSFGEHGFVFHSLSPYEAVLHVPLWIRWPGGDGGHTVSDRVSLVDIVPTLLAAAGIPRPTELAGVPLQGGAPPVRTTPVLAMADGYPSVVIHRERVETPVLEHLRRVNAIAYDGDLKALVEVRTGALSVFDLGRDPEESSDLGSRLGVSSRNVEEAARGAAARIQGASKGGVDTVLEDRLHSWGYV